MNYCNHKCHKRYGFECIPCQSQNKPSTEMTTNYTIIKELQERVETLTYQRDKNLSVLNELIVKFDKQNDELFELRKVKKKVVETLEDSKFKSNKLFAENIQSVIDKINDTRPNNPN